MRVSIPFAVCLSCLLGCETLPKRPAGAMPIEVDTILDDKAMQREVEKHISVGMSVARARALLKTHGFTFEEHKNEQRIFCETVESAGWLVTYRATVWLSYDEHGKVTKIEARGSSLGL